MAPEGTSTAPGYTWKIKSFSKSTSNKLLSDVFVLGGYKWQLMAYLMQIRDDKYMSLFLEVADSSELPEGWSRDMESLTFTVVNQFDAQDSIELSTKHRFHAQEPGWGFHQFMHLEGLENPAEGFLVDDLLLVKVCFSESEESSLSTVLLNSENLLAELSSMNRTQRSTSRSTLPLKTQSLLYHREALQHYLTFPLETMMEANAFDDIVRIADVLVQHSSNSLEKSVLMDLVSRLETFKETHDSTKSYIEDVRAVTQKIADVGARLDHGREQLYTLEANYSELSEEELKLKDEIFRLTIQEEIVRDRKMSVSFELEKVNEQVSKDLGEWRNISKELGK